MLVFKIILWVILAVLGIILLLLVLPVSGQISYIDKRVSYSVRYAFLGMYDSDGKGLIPWFKNRRKKKKIPEDDAESEETDIPEDDAESEETDIPEDNAESEETDIPEDDAESEETDIIEDNAESEETDIPEDNAESEETDIPEDDAESEEPNIPEDDTESEKTEKKTLGEKLEYILNIWEIAGRPVLKIFKGFRFSGLYIDFAIANEDAYKCALNYGRICGGVYSILAWLGVLFTVKYKTVDVFPDFDAKESRYDAAVKISFNFMNIIIAALWFAVMYIFKISIPNKKKKKQK